MLRRSKLARVLRNKHKEVKIGVGSRESGIGIKRRTHQCEYPNFVSANSFSRDFCSVARRSC